MRVEDSEYRQLAQQVKERRQSSDTEGSGDERRVLLCVCVCMCVCFCMWSFYLMGEIVSHYSQFPNGRGAATMPKCNLCLGQRAPR